MKAKTRCIILAFIFLAVVIGAGLHFNSKKEVAFSDMIGIPPEQIVSIEIKSEAAPGTSTFTLDDEQKEKLLGLLSKVRCQKTGTGSVTQGCYARVFITAQNSSEIEVMLSPQTVLVNNIGSTAEGKIYDFLSDSTEIKNYILNCTTG
jgi:hypothetical protein